MRLVIQPIFILLVCLVAQTAVSQRQSARSNVLGATEIYSKFEKSVVLVEDIDATGRVFGTGSGVVVAPEQVVTNYHVTEGAVKIRIKDGDRVLDAQITHAIVEQDICRLFVKGLSSRVAPKVRAFSDLRVGERVFALGYPLALEQSLSEESVSESLSEGLVSALHQIPLNRIQTTAPISSGSSGGALLDEQGRLIGITQSQYTRGQNMNLAVPADYVNSLGANPFSDTTGAAKAARVNALLPVIMECTMKTSAQNPNVSDECLKDWKEFAEIIGRGWAWDGLGTLDRLNGKAADGLAAHKKAVQITPTDATFQRNLGYAYIDVNDEAHAMEAFEQALRLDPKEMLALRGKALIHCRWGERSSALMIYQKLLAEDERAAKDLKQQCPL